MILRHLVKTLHQLHVQRRRCEKLHLRTLKQFQHSKKFLTISTHPQRIQQLPEEAPGLRRVLGLRQPVVRLGLLRRLREVEHGHRLLQVFHGEVHLGGVAYFSGLVTVELLVSGNSDTSVILEMKLAVVSCQMSLVNYGNGG